jgi:hypothetical protein
MWAGYLGRTRKISNQGAYVAYSDPYRNVQRQLVYKRVSRYGKLLHWHILRRLTAASLISLDMRLMPQELERGVRDGSEKANIDVAPIISVVFVDSCVLLNSTQQKISFRIRFTFQTSNIPVAIFGQARLQTLCKPSIQCMPYIKVVISAAVVLRCSHVSKRSKAGA